EAREQAGQLTHELAVDGRVIAGGGDHPPRHIAIRMRDEEAVAVEVENADAAADARDSYHVLDRRYGVGYVSEHRRSEARIEARVAEGQRAAIARLPLDARREPGQSRARIETNDPAAFADAARDSAGHRAAAATDIEDALAGRDGEELEIRVAGRHFVGRLGAQLEPRGELAGLLAAHPR